MMQRIKDFLLLLQRDRKVQVVTLAVVGCGLYLMLADNNVVRRAPKPKPQVNVGGADPDERWKDLVERFNGQLTTLSTQMKDTQGELNTQKEQIREYEKTTAEIFKKILERLAEVQNTNTTPQQASGMVRHLQHARWGTSRSGRAPPC